MIFTADEDLLCDERYVRVLMYLCGVYQNSQSADEKSPVN